MKKVLFLIVAFLIVAPQWSEAQRVENATVYLRNGSKLIGEVSEANSAGRMEIRIPNGTYVRFTEKSVKEIVYDSDEPAVRRSFRVLTTVNLNNGSVLKGRLTEMEDGDRLRIETSNGSVIYFSERSVSDMEDEEVSLASRGTRQSAYQAETRQPAESQYKERGYRGFAELGYTIGIGDYLDDNRIELSTSHGYQFNPHFFLGGGMGVHYFHQAYSDVYALPFYVDFRASFTKGRISPFGGLKLGYSIGITDEDAGDLGTYIAPSIGVRFKLGYSFGLNLSAGYSVQLVQYEDYYSRTTENLGGFTIRAGIEF